MIGLLNIKLWKIAIISFAVGVGVTVGLVLLFYFLSGQMRESADEQAARALCATSVGSPELIAPCTKALVARIRLERQIRE
jgi:hypothetical protein